MPYIKPDVRKNLDGPIKWLVEALETTDFSPGDLNYVFTKLMYTYLDKHGKRYQSLNDLVGALECSKLELYRRAVAPYEDLKIVENGDVGSKF